jgi:protein gp37
MGTKTGISWTDATWNPIRGCSRVSEGCRHCYAESVAHRFSGPGLPYEGLVQLGADGKSTGKWNGSIKFVEEHLLDPLRWKKPRRIFVNSMSDLFHKNLADEIRDKIYAVAAMCPESTFQILTKRQTELWDYWFLISTQHRLWRISRAIDELFPAPTKASIAAKERLFEGGPIPNIIHGISAEDQPNFDQRWNVLSRLKACGFLTMLSCEPLLSAIDLGDAKPDWVIVGGESGPGARPMNPDWARSLRDQCKAAGVPFFFKQWGEWGDWDGTEENDHQAAAVASIVNDERKWPTHLHNFGEDPENGDWAYRIGTKTSGCLLDGVEHHEFPNQQQELS